MTQTLIFFLFMFGEPPMGNLYLLTVVQVMRTVNYFPFTVFCCLWSVIMGVSGGDFSVFMRCQITAVVMAKCFLDSNPCAILDVMSSGTSHHCQHGCVITRQKWRI